MSKIYFPGANTGCGFVSKFCGIVPPDEKTHYTYVLKGGPGVGKNTLMKTVAERARKKNMSVEEFRCASDPKSLDAIRIPNIRTVILDGTSPHCIDPAVPGICDEVIDLGHFKNKSEFAKRRAELDTLFSENRKCYKKAYALLGAARILKEHTLEAVVETLDLEKTRSFLSNVIKSAKDGRARELFISSATPDGIVDFSESFSGENTVYLSGTVGEAMLFSASEMLCGKSVTLGFDFVLPTSIRAVAGDDFSIIVKKDEAPDASLPPYVYCFSKESARLAGLAAEALTDARNAHNKIEEIYRPYVDYTRVNAECEKLLAELNV
ncbi:MAG: hypothetical protein IKU61_03075 [Clostridia bacterium]|nr:hypothetical protein [Clostridia bacterium]